MRKRAAKSEVVPKVPAATTIAWPPGARSMAGRPAYFQEAVSYAARAHRHQLRKDGKTPYVAHVLRVAFTVVLMFECDDPVAVQAAILHDTIEDTTTDYEDVSGRFGDATAACVSALTKHMNLPEGEREREYDRRLAAAPWQARLVKLADCYDNLCDLEDFSDVERSQKAYDAVQRAHRAVALGARGVDALPDEAARAMKHACAMVADLAARVEDARVRGWAGKR